MKNHARQRMHINISVQKSGQAELFPYLVSGILEKAYEMTVFLNPIKSSYYRLGNQQSARIYNMVRRKPLSAHPIYPRRRGSIGVLSCAPRSDG
jgi:hypothetical protein